MFGISVSPNGSYAIKPKILKHQNNGERQYSKGSFNQKIIAACKIYSKQQENISGPYLPHDAAQCRAVHPFKSRKLILTPEVTMGAMAQS